MQASDLTVRRIKDGTVIDHIDQGRGIKVLEALGIDGKEGNVITIALNVPSGKSKKKDIIKVENRYLEDDDILDIPNDVPPIDAMAASKLRRVLVLGS